jgi:hypothetical protein
LRNDASKGRLLLWDPQWSEGEYGGGSVVHSTNRRNDRASKANRLGIEKSIWERDFDRKFDYASIFAVFAAHGALAHSPILLSSPEVLNPSPAKCSRMCYASSERANNPNNSLKSINKSINKYGS